MTALHGIEAFEALDELQALADKEHNQRRWDTSRIVKSPSHFKPFSDFKHESVYYQITQDGWTIEQVEERLRLYGHVYPMYIQEMGGFYSLAADPRTAGVLEVLLTRGLDPSIRCDYLLHIYQFSDFVYGDQELDMANILNANYTMQMSLLCLATESNNPQAVDLLISYGANLSNVDKAQRVMTICRSLYDAQSYNFETLAKYIELVEPALLLQFVDLITSFMITMARGRLVIGAARANIEDMTPLEHHRVLRSLIKGCSSIRLWEVFINRVGIAGRYAIMVKVERVSNNEPPPRIFGSFPRSYGYPTETSYQPTSEESLMDSKLTFQTYGTASKSYNAQMRYAWTHRPSYWRPRYHHHYSKAQRARVETLMQIHTLAPESSWASLPLELVFLIFELSLGICLYHTDDEKVQVI